MPQHYPLIPDQAFLYFPSPNQILCQRQKQTQPHRIIFDGNIPFTSFQHQKLSQFLKQLCKKQKNNNLSSYKTNFILRFLQATQFNHTNCIKALREYYQWQKNNLPLKLTPNIQKLLKQGILYMSGRDYCYRPILIVNVGKILQLQPKEKLFIDTLGYFFQFIIQNCLIQGQVENWVTIIDLGNASVFSLGGTLVDTITFLSSIFRSRVHHSYLVNAPSSVKWVWGMVKGALNQDQLRKLSLSGKKQLNQQDFIQINKSQVQIKYGGTKPNITNYWPLTHSLYYFGSVQTQKSKYHHLITKQQYNKKYHKKQLQKRKVNKKLIHPHDHNHNHGHINLTLNHPRPSSILHTLNRQSQQSRITMQISSQNSMNITRSQLEDDLNEINLKIPKQKCPPELPKIPESNQFQTFINQLINKFFD